MQPIIPMLYYCYVVDYAGTAGATGRRQTSSARLRQTVRDAPEQLDMRLASQVMFLSEKSLNVPSHLRG